MKEKRKFYLYLLVLVVLVIAVYFLAIKKTLSLKNTIHQLENQQFSVEQLNNQLHELDKRLLESKLSSAVLAEKANRFILQYNPHPFVIEEINPPHRIKQGDLNIQTYTMSFRASYINALQFIHYLEQSENIPISSIQMELKKRKIEDKNERKLITTIFIQNITNNENPE